MHWFLKAVREQPPNRQWVMIYLSSSTVIGGKKRHFDIDLQSFTIEFTSTPKTHPPFQWAPIDLLDRGKFFRYLPFWSYNLSTPGLRETSVILKCLRNKFLSQILKKVDCYIFIVYSCIIPELSMNHWLKRWVFHENIIFYLEEQKSHKSTKKN